MQTQFRTTELDTFFYWMTEREKIYAQRQAGKPAPWTKDPILQTYKFTNVFRQNDRVTKALRSYVEPKRNATPGDLLGNIAAFRLFNWPDTYAALGGWRTGWDTAKAIATLRARADSGEKVFTGAYVVSNNGSTEPKINLVCEAVETIWNGRRETAARVMAGNSMEQAVEILAELPMVGRFVAYELACDLRYTKVLERATDKRTWANLGPGADRGLRWLLNGTVESQRVTQGRGVELMRELLRIAPAALPKGFPPLEMREVEHSLCEFDKYMRLKTNTGKVRAKFTPHVQAARPVRVTPARHAQREATAMR
jgi:hypothetical protein